MVKEGQGDESDDNGATPSSTTDCDIDSQEEIKEVPEIKKGKKAIEAEAKKGKATKRRKNEKIKVVATPPEVVLEPTTTSEGSNPTDAPSKDSSEEVTTDKVEAIVEVKKVNPWDKPEVPDFVKNFANKGWLGAHGTIPLVDGGNFQLHAVHGFDAHGKSIEIPFADIPKPSIKGLTEAEQKVVIQEYDVAINEARMRRTKELIGHYERFNRLLPELTKLCLKKVWCWNKASDKKLGITGTFVGLQGGVCKHTVLIDGTGHDGKAKKIRRGFRFISIDLPKGESVAPTTPLRNAVDVEKGVDKKLLEDKRSTKIVYPVGYDKAIKNLTLSEGHHTILVWNQQGQQMSFYASENLDAHSNSDGFKWQSFDFQDGNVVINNNVIGMKGSVQELLRVTVKINQNYVSNMIVVSIPKSDAGQLASLMAVLNTGTVTEGTDSEGKKQ